MRKGKRAAANKQPLWDEISAQLGIEVDPTWYSTGSNVNASAFETALRKIAERTGVPPSFLNDSEQLVWRMLHKSQEAMVQAIQTVNNPTIIYRLETFLFLFVNAWELLLKSYLIHTTGKIEEIEVNGEEDKSISIRTSINKVFVQDENPIKQNLIYLTDLRNQVAHKTVPIFPETVSMLAQAGIFNYERTLNQMFNRSLNDRIPGGMIFLVSSLDPLNFSVDHALLSKRLTKEVAGILKEWEGKVKQVVENTSDSELSRFALPITIKATSVNNPKKADILIAFDPAKIENAILVERKINTLDQYPLSYSDLLLEVKRRIPLANQNDVNKAIAAQEIKQNPIFAGYSHRTKKDEEQFIKTGKLKTSSTSIYNFHAVEAVCKWITKQLSSSKSKS